jgi:hypothetical protein
VSSSVQPGAKSCEVAGWCPTEHDSDRLEDNVIRNALNYTIFIKNDVEFKRFKKKQYLNELTTHTTVFHI